MLVDTDKILKTVTLSKIKSAIATLVWDMQLDCFNADILDVITLDIYAKLPVIKEPCEVNGTQWERELETEVERFICHDTKPALSILPYFDKINHQLIAAYAFGGSRHSVMHVVATVGLIKNKISKGATIAKIASPGNIDGSLPWFMVAKDIRSGKSEERIAELLNIAIGYEVEVMNR